MVAQNLFHIENIAQDYTHAKVISPRLELCKNQTQEDYEKKRENAVIGESVRSGYLPKLKLKQG